jgi:hypothetical protein
MTNLDDLAKLAPFRARLGMVWAKDNKQSLSAAELLAIANEWAELRARLAASEADRDQWRKGLDLIRGTLTKFAGAKLETIHPVDINRTILVILADRERTEAALATLSAHPGLLPETDEVVTREDLRRLGLLRDPAPKEATDA